MKSSSVFSLKTGGNHLATRLADILIILVSLVVASKLYGVQLNREYLMTLLVVLVVYSYVAEGVNLYRSWRAGKFREMVFAALLSLCLAFLGLLIFAFIFKFSEQLSRVTIGIWFSFSFVTLFLSRIALRVYKIHKRKLGFNVKTVAVIGATHSGINITKQIEAHNELGYQNIGFYDDRAPERFDNLNVDIVGTIEDAVTLAKKGLVQVLFIAIPINAEKRIADILSRLGDTTVDVHIVPDFLLSSLMHARIDHVGNMDTLSIFESPYLGASRWIKRTEDIVLSLIILTLISPLLVFISLAIKLTSRGPVLFKQYRYGLAGHKIKVWKFRSMNVMENSDVVTQATKNDNRITPLGGFLRRTSLDELPQFFNTLMGSMSIVGPRPHAVSHNEEYRGKIEFYMLRHKVKPGITGWAQINGWRGETDTLEKMEKRIEFDLEYIKHWSLWFDVKIVFLTIFKGFTNKNAY